MKQVINMWRNARLLWLIIGFGISVRLIQYLSNRSLWADEAVLALNIVNRSYSELGQPLDYDQAAPIGFLLVEKFAIQLFGNNEYALRLFPLFAGIISLFLFARLSQWCLSQTGRIISLVLFASLPSLIYYASEVKQYASDVAISLLLCVLLLPIKQQKLTRAKTIIYSLIVAISIWFSHPAIFVLAGMGCSELIIWYKSKKKKYWLRKLIIYSSGLLSFSLFYLFFVRNLTNNQTLMDSWDDAFPSSPLNLIWFLDSLGKFFYNPLGFEGGLDGLAIFIFAIGCFSYFSRNKAILISLISPLFMTFLAASLQGYPFRGRLVLFLTPFFIIIIAEGASYLLKYKRNRLTITLGILLSILLVIFPILNVGSILNKPQLKEEIKPVISYIKTHQQPGDILYIYQRGIYQFLYYAEKYGYLHGDYIIGVDDLDQYDGEGLSEREWQRYKQDLDKLRGNKRVWLLFSHANKASENTAIQSYLDRIGQKVDFFAAPGSFVYLYDLSTR
ncbi:hypothetical protein IQ238_15415 [Pleurocapsales cyanobacterium LEGE 06147]|nr:hypothetical protein [Pleurocapsales cyanobacterium LEGE 06147]